MTDSYLRDLNYKIQLEQMLLNSWGVEKPREANKKFELPDVNDLLNPKERQNKILMRQEQIQSYLEKEKRPVVINGVEYKYNSISPPNLDDLQQYKDDIGMLEGNINYYENGINQALNNIKQSEDIIKQIKSQKKILAENRSMREFFLNKEYIKKLNDLEAQKLNAQTPTEVSKITDEIALLNNEALNISSEINQIKSDLRLFDNDIKQEIKNIKKYENNIKSLEAHIETEKDAINENIKNMNEAKKQNNEKTNQYSNELRRLNFGSFNIDRLPTETEEEYIKRLDDNAQVPFDNSYSKNLSDIERNNEFKDNLKQLFKSDAFIEQILNYLKMHNDHFIYIFNTYFNLFKEDYLKIFGFNNKALLDEPDQFIEIINKFCEADANGQPSLITPETKRVSSLLEPINQQISLLKEDTTIDNLTYQQKVDELNRLQSISGGDQNKILALESNLNQISGPKAKLDSFNPQLLDGNTTIKFQDPTTNETKYLKYLDYNAVYALRDDGKNNSITKTPPTLLISDVNQPGTYEEYSNKDFSDFLQMYFGLSKDDIRNLLNIKTVGNVIPGKSILNFFKVYQLKPTLTQNDNQQTEIKLKPGTKLIGMGISSDLKEYVKFGKYVLLYKKLILKNILSLQKNNGQKIPGFKNYNVSDQFVDLIKKMLNKENISAYDVNTLKIGEKELLDNLLALCELNKKIIIGSGSETLKKIKNNLEVIQGEIEGGNNNPIVKDELYKTLFKLVMHGAISEKNARDHYKKIVKDFFT